MVTTVPRTNGLPRAGEAALGSGRSEEEDQGLGPCLGALRGPGLLLLPSICCALLSTGRSWWPGAASGDLGAGEAGVVTPTGWYPAPRGSMRVVEMMRMSIGDVGAHWVGRSLPRGRSQCLPLEPGGRASWRGGEEGVEVSGGELEGCGKPGNGPEDP